jgi:hypothetical protein
MLKIIGSKETSQIAMVTGSEPGKWGKNGRRGASRHFKNEKGEYLKDKIKKLVTHIMIKNISDLYR